MSDLIRREDVIEAIFSKPAWHGSDGSWYHSDDIRDAIGSTPSARPQGQWINRDGGLATCSVCGDRWGVWDVMNYCPNCGADMRGAENGTDKDKFEQ